MKFDDFYYDPDLYFKGFERGHIIIRNQIRLIFLLEFFPEFFSNYFLNYFSNFFDFFTLNFYCDIRIYIVEFERGHIVIRNQIRFYFHFFPNFFSQFLFFEIFPNFFSNFFPNFFRIFSPDFNQYRYLFTINLYYDPDLYYRI